MRAVRTLQLLLLAVAVCALSSCRHSSHVPALVQADSIIEADPETALEILSGVQRAALSEKDAAYYALLYTQAQVKCGVRLQSDSLIGIACHYYRKNTGNLGTRARFYNAKVLYYSGNLRQAIGDVLVAYEYAKDNNDSYWVAKSAELISDIFFRAYNYSQAEIYTHEAIKHYALAGKTTNTRYALCDLATIYLNENNNDRALELLDSLRLVCEGEQPADSVILEYINEPYFVAMVKTGNAEELSATAYSANEENATADEVIDRSITQSYLYQLDGDYDKSGEILSDASILANSDEQKARVLYGMYIHAKATDNYKEAASLADTLLYMQSEIAENILKESIIGAQSDFYSAKAVENENKLNALTLILIAVFVAAIIITLLLWWIYRLNIRNKTEQLEATIATVAELKKEIDATADLQEQNAQIIETLFKEKWSTLNMLCYEYFEKGESEQTRNTIINSIGDELKKLRSKKSLKQIEEAVDNYLGGIMSLLRKECAFLSEDEFTFLALVFAGLSVRAVCIITDIKYKLYYLKKSRLTKRISESDAPHKNEFLSRLA